MENVTVEIIVTSNDGDFAKEAEFETLTKAIEYLEALKARKVTGVLDDF